MFVKVAPCPFCGTEDKDGEIVFHEYGDDQGSAVAVGCCVCGALGPVVRGPMIGDCTDRQVAQAAVLWNKARS